MEHTHTFRHTAGLALLALLSAALTGTATADDGVFVRFRLLEPKDSGYYVRLGGYIHKSPWYLPKAVIPDGADKDLAKRLEAGQFTPWFDLAEHAGDRLHERLNRAGGVAEFPNVTADFVCDLAVEQRTVIIQLATSNSEDRIVREWNESFSGSLTSFLVSPHLARDASHLETAAEMTARRLDWARAATGGERQSPKELIVQTSFWSPQRTELNLREAEVLHLLGFNVVGNQRTEVRQQFDFHSPGHTHGVKFGPAATREEIDALMENHAQRHAEPLVDGVPFGFTDEVVCRPPIGDDPQALTHFHRWLATQAISPKVLGVKKLENVVPIESPEVLKLQEKEDGPAARRAFYYTSRFRQHAATERIRWHTEAFHKHSSSGALTSTLVADHPYFAGSGLGMGMTPNAAWGNYPLSCDWFDLGRRRAVDLIGIEDWMGLQYMYGPNSTWEGFQLMGFQASIFRSASRASLPIIAWVTPSDETNLRLKTASALCQGAKHFFYWTYGPTATSTENYWSDLRGAYDGIAAVTRQLTAAEHILAAGRPRRTRVALLYSISSDLWQPFGYVHMLERRGLYLSLVHDQFLVDMLSEEDVQAGRLADYDVLYTADPCIKTSAAEQIAVWVRQGGHLFATTAAGSRNEFNEASATLAPVFGIAPDIESTSQPGRYHIRGALNNMDWLDEISMDSQSPDELQPAKFGAIGTKTRFQPTTAQVVGSFGDGSPAVVTNDFGSGKAQFVGTCPAIAYLKDAEFVPDRLAEQWPPEHRRFINHAAIGLAVRRVAELSCPVVECGVYDSPRGSALVLANFTYEPIRALQVRLTLPGPVQKIRSLQHGTLPFTTEETSEHPEHRIAVSFQLPLGLTDIVLAE